MCKRTKSQGLLAENALEIKYFDEKRLVTWQQQIRKFSVKDVNLDTITDTLSWYNIWLLNGYNLIRVKPILLRRPKGVYESFSRCRRSQESLYSDNSLEFGKASEDLSWNHCASMPHRSETNGIAEGAVRRIKEGTGAVLLESGLDEKWWVNSVECYCYLRSVQDLLAMWKHLTNGDSANHSKDQ